MRRAWTSLALLATFGPWLAGPAAAELRLRTTGRLATGFTDNVDSRPRTAPANDPSTPTAIADGFTEVEPALVLVAASTRAVHELGYTFAATLYFRTEEVNSYANRLDWLGLFELTDAVRLRLNTVASQGRQNSLSLQGEADSTAVGIRPAGGELFFTGQVEQALDWDVSPRWTLSQAFAFSPYVPIDSDTRTTLDFDAHVDALYSLDDRLSVGAEASYMLSLGLTGGTQTQDTAIIQLLGRSVLQLARSWSLELRAGLVRVALPDKARAQIFQPTGMAMLRLADRDLEVELSVAHTVRANVVVADPFLLQQVRLRARAPLGNQRDARWFVEGTAGYDHGLAIDLANREITGDNVHVALADAALYWRMNGYLEWAVRYQFAMQTETAGHPDIIPFYRQAATLGASFHFPPESTRARMPRDRRRFDDHEWQRLFFPPSSPAKPSNGTGPGS